MAQPHRVIDQDDCRVTYFGQIFSGTEAVELFKHLRGLEWQREIVRIRGREFQAARSTLFMGEPGIVYRYAGKEAETVAWDDRVSEIRKRVEEKTGETFNAVFLNLYDAKGKIGYHSDSEKDIAPRSCIASVSFGEERIFYLKRKSGKEDPVKVALQDGSLLTMEGRTQEEWKHAVPSLSRYRDERINLTFRTMLVSTNKRKREE